MSIYLKNQTKVIEKLEEDNSRGINEIEHIGTIAYQIKVLKSEDQKKLKGETVEYFLQEKTLNKFKTVKIKNEKKHTISNEKGIVFGMTNFEKWIYFLFNKDIR